MEVLLVEDDPTNRTMIARRLRRHDFTVRETGTAEEALEEIRSDHPDVVLMDLSLPEMDGYEATRELKEHEATASIPVLVVTANAMERDREQAFEAGCDEFVTKPVDIEELTEKIEAEVSP